MNGKKEYLLNYCRKLIEKARSLCAKQLKNIKKDVKKRVKKAVSFCAKRLKSVKKQLKQFIEKLKSFCAAHLNVKRLDVFLIIAVIAVFVYVAVNHSCGAVNGPARTNITISSQCVNLFGRDTIDTLIQEFERQNPELRIRVAAALDNADIVFFDDSEFGGLMNVSALVPLVSFMDIFVYNIDVLQAAGLDRPPKTRAEFLAAAKTVAENSTVSAFALGLNPYDPLALRRDFYPWIWASGVDIHALDLSGNNPALPRAVTDTIAFLGQLNREGLLAPDTFEKNGIERLQEFAEGKIAMLTISARDIAYLRNNAADITFSITTLPAATQMKNRLGLSGIYAGINSASAVPDEAKVFISFLARKSDVLAAAIGAVPGSYPAIFAGDHIAKDPLYSKAWEIFSAADIVDYKFGQPSEETFNRLVREKLVDALKVEPPKEEPPKAEPPPRAEPPRAETPRAEPPRAEPPAVEAPKVEAPQAETPAESP